MDDQFDDGKGRKKLSPGLLKMLRVNAERRAAGLHVGRPRGGPNVLTTMTRKALLAVFEELGGVEAMTKWARKHPTQFYALFVKAAPKEREANAAGTGVQIIINDGSNMRPAVIDVPVLPEDEGEDQGPAH